MAAKDSQVMHREDSNLVQFSFEKKAVCYLWKISGFAFLLVIMFFIKQSHEETIHLCLLLMYQLKQFKLIAFLNQKKNQEKRAALGAAVYSGDLKEVQSLVASGKKKKWQAKKIRATTFLRKFYWHLQMQLLHARYFCEIWTFQKKKKQIAEILGANPKAVLDDGNSQNGLHMSAYSGHYELVEYFLRLENGPDINSRDAQGWTGKFFGNIKSFLYSHFNHLL